MEMINSVILSLLLNILRSYAFFPPTFITQPPKGEVLFKEGSTINLPCLAKAYPNANYEWLKNEYSIENVMINQNDGTLTIEKARRESEGDYQCIAYNSYGRAYSHISILKMAYISSYSGSNTERVIDVFLGASAILECDKSSSYPPPTIQWFYIEDKFKIISFEEDYRRVIDNKGNLHITKILKQDQNKSYSCVSNNSFMKTMQRGPDTRINIRPDTDVNILLRQPNRPIIKLYNSSTNNIVLRNSTLILTCIFSRGKVTWKKGNKILKNNKVFPNIKIIRQTTTLTIQNIDLSDSGDYICSPDNQNNELDVKFNVKVVYKPIFTRIPRDKTVAINGSHIFQCNAIAEPAPTIRWSVNGKSVRQILDGNKIQMDANKIYMKQLTSKDIFVIQCNASNPYGYVYTNAYINVWYKKPLLKSTPTKYIKGILKKNVKVVCQAFSVPRPKVNWKKDSYNINSDFNNKYIMDGNGDLIIKNLNSNDAGVYECIASNQFGTSKLETTVVVRQPTKITSVSEDIRTKTQSNIKLQCTSETDRLESKNHHINWYFEAAKTDTTLGVLVSNNNNNGEKTTINQRRLLKSTLNSDIGAVFIKSDLKLNFLNPKDTGFYYCNATNNLDFDLRKIQVIVEDIPQPPFALAVDCHKFSAQRKASLTWIDGFHNNNPINAYIIEFQTQVDQKHWFQIGPITIQQINRYKVNRKSSKQKSYSIDIHPYQNYKFRIRSNNKLGISNPSPISTNKCQLRETKPNDNPTDIFVYGTQPNSLKIKWKPIPYLKHNGPNMTYHFLIRCFNCDMVSQFAESQFTMSDWTRESVVLHNITIDKKPIQIEIYKKYGVKIQSKNALGYCTNIPTMKFGYSAENYPTVKPKELNILSVTSSNVELSWRILSKNDLDKIHGFFRGYRLEWCVNRNFTMDICENRKHYKDIILFKPNNLELKNRLEISALDNRQKRSPFDYTDLSYYRSKYLGSIYKFKLQNLPGLSEIKIWSRVINIQYAGPRSVIRTIHTNEGIPGPVAEFSAESLQINYVELAWTQPIVTNGRLIGYDIEVRRALSNGAYGPSVSTVHIKDKLQIRTRISNLRPATTYFISIWAITKPGRGEEKQIKITTRQENKETSLIKLKIRSLSNDAYNISLKFTTKIKNILMINQSRNGARSSAGAWLFYVQFRLTQNVIWEETEKQYSKWWIVITNLEHDKSYIIRSVLNTAKGSIVTKSVVLRTSQSRNNAFAMILHGSGTTWFVLLLLLILGLLCGIIGLFVWRRKKVIYMRGKNTPLTISDNHQFSMNDPQNQITHLYDRYTSFVNHSTLGTLPQTDHNHNPLLTHTSNNTTYPINGVISNQPTYRDPSNLNATLSIGCIQPGQTIENDIYDKYPFYLKNTESPTIPYTSLTPNLQQTIDINSTKFNKNPYNTTYYNYTSSSTPSPTTITQHKLHFNSNTPNNDNSIFNNYQYPPPQPPAAPPTTSISSNNTSTTTGDLSVQNPTKKHNYNNNDMLITNAQTGHISTSFV